MVTAAQHFYDGHRELWKQMELSLFQALFSKFSLQKYVLTAVFVHLAL